MSTPVTTRAALALAACAVVGGAVGVGAAAALDTPQRYSAKTTLVLMPNDEVVRSNVSNYFEVITRGQVISASAYMLGQARLLPAAAEAAGVDESELALTSTAIPNTALIQVRVHANSPEAAERALAAVVAEGADRAAGVSGPFELLTISPPEGSAVSVGPTKEQTAGAAGLVGAAFGLGGGLLAARWRGRDAKAPSAPAAAPAAPVGQPGAWPATLGRRHAREAPR